MSRKNKSSDIEIINIDSKDYEIIESTNNINSVGKEVVVKLGVEAGKAFIPVALEAIKKKLEHDQETQKLSRDDKRYILNQRAEKLISRIENEEDKLDYDQDRINRWNLELEKIMNKQEMMNNKSEGFTKGVLSTAKEFISSKLK